MEARYRRCASMGSPRKETQSGLETCDRPPEMELGAGLERILSRVPFFKTTREQGYSGLHV